MYYVLCTMHALEFSLTAGNTNRHTPHLPPCPKGAQINFRTQVAQTAPDEFLRPQFKTIGRVTSLHNVLQIDRTAEDVLVVPWLLLPGCICRVGVCGCAVGGSGDSSTIRSVKIGSEDGT